jgi:hypothetical protein
MQFSLFFVIPQSLIQLTKNFKLNQLRQLNCHAREIHPLCKHLLDLKSTDFLTALQIYIYMYVYNVDSIYLKCRHRISFTILDVCFESEFFHLSFFFCCSECLYYKVNNIKEEEFIKFSQRNQ